MVFLSPKTFNGIEKHRLQLTKLPPTTPNLKSQPENSFPNILKPEFHLENSLSYTPKSKFKLETAFSDNQKAIFHNFFVFSY